MNDLTTQAPFVTLHNSDCPWRSGECVAKRFFSNTSDFFKKKRTLVLLLRLSFAEFVPVSLSYDSESNSHRLARS
jgi:hypothetical protein